MKFKLTISDGKEDEDFEFRTGDQGKDFVKGVLIKLVDQSKLLNDDTDVKTV